MDLVVWIESSSLEGATSGLETALGPSSLGTSSLLEPATSLSALEPASLRATSWTAALPGRAFRPGSLRLGELVGGEQVFGCHVHSLALFEAARVDSFCGLDAEVEGVERAEDFVDGAHLGLVLQVDGAVELGEAAHVGALDHEVLFGTVHVGAVGDDVAGRALVEVAVAAVSSPAPSASPAALSSSSPEVAPSSSAFVELLAHYYDYSSTVLLISSLPIIQVNISGTKIIRKGVLQQSLSWPRYFSFIFVQLIV